MPKHVPLSFNQGIARQIVEEKRTVTEMADQIGKHRATVGKWVKDYKQNQSAGEFKTEAGMRELQRTYERRINR
ncbi:transposase [Alkalicoccus luteus]|uniref:Transposase n=1 Tax=Alkalicoccus luteus TaxID=1237094 RepID=A0A969TXM6_9BACI|nr:transposase [Alkalicoccus luteus]NJP38364.1 transposase [Alkalicoccus luteus]